MKRYIDAYEVKRQIRTATEGEVDVMKVFLKAMYSIDNIPTADVVEVVRCKDCIHNEHNAEAPNALCELYYGMTDQYGFCSDGERNTK